MISETLIALSSTNRGESLIERKPQLYRSGKCEASSGSFESGDEIRRRPGT